MVVMLAALLGPLPAVAQVGPPRARQQMERMRDRRRAELEGQIRDRFTAQVARRLGLEGEDRDRLQQVLVEGAERRAELMRVGGELQAELRRAVEAGDTPESGFQDLLDRLLALRAREQEAARWEEAALAEFLSPRQQVEFMFLRMQFNERVRMMRGTPPGPTAWLIGPSRSRYLDRMRVRTLFFATYRELAGVEELEIELPAGSTAADLVASLRTRDELRRLPARPVVAVNQTNASLSTSLATGDEVALLPPVAGG